MVPTEKSERKEKDNAPGIKASLEKFLQPASPFVFSIS
jgi:hypothetical protein